MNDHPGWSKDLRCLHCGELDASKPCTFSLAAHEAYISDDGGADHDKDCSWRIDWHTCSCGAFDSNE